MFDECADLSGKAQISLILRYVYFPSNGPVIREDFVAFIDAFGELGNMLEEEKEENEVDDDKLSEMCNDNKPTKKK